MPANTWTLQRTALSKLLVCGAHLFATLCVFCAFVAPVLANAQAEDEPEVHSADDPRELAMKVSQINIVGFKRIEEDAIREKLVTKVGSPFSRSQDRKSVV